MRDRVARFGEHHNAFGLVRLILAALVILSHTPEMVDGNRSREILSKLYGTLSFGELAVAGFFVVSGYLITGSWLKRPNWLQYLKNRTARILPGYLVCFFVCLVIVAPLAGATDLQLTQNIHSLMRLYVPLAENVFAGTPHQSLNGSMWTISLEFRCYVLVAVLGVTRLLRFRFIAPTVFVLFTLFAAVPTKLDAFVSHVPHYGLIFGDDAKELARLTATFLVGACYWLHRDRIVFRPFYALGATAAILWGMAYHASANVVIAIFGGYLIFYFAHRARGVITQINNRNDVSYGVYLYAWPIEKLIFWYLPNTPLAIAGLSTLILAYGLGWLSWLFIEQPVLRFANDRVGRTLPLNA